jgi:CRP-like cAMP-binding protein
MSDLEQKVLDALQTKPLPELVRELVTEAELSLRHEQAALRNRAAECPANVRAAVERAADALDAACAAASEPVRTAVGLVVARVLKDLGIRLEASRPRGSANAPPGTDVALRVLRTAGAAGATTADVARGCGVTVKVARRLCEELVRDGHAVHNGKPRQESRYHSRDVA